VQAMFDASVTHLTPEQAKQLAMVLNNYEDVFTKNEFDLSHFTEIDIV
jgi:hypothetical protein